MKRRWKGGEATFQARALLHKQKRELTKRRQKTLSTSILREGDPHEIRDEGSGGEVRGLTGQREGKDRN